ncbi:MAG: SDR family NAD(P)-dependent oxidoreductase [Bacteroidota bacterium]
MTGLTVSIMGCGWLGIPLAETLIKESTTIKGSTTREEKLPLLKEKGIEPYLISLSPEQMIGDLPSFLDTDIVIINIPPGRKSGSVEESYMAKIEEVARNINQKRTKGIIFVSSTSVYGNIKGVVRENATPEPVTSSGKALLRSERFIQSLSVPVSNLRLGGLIGPDRHPGRFFRRVSEVQNGDAPVNLIGLEDVIGVILRIMKYEAWGETFHLASTEHPTKRAFYSYAIEAFGGHSPIFKEGGEDAKLIDSSTSLQKLQYELKHADLFEYVSGLSSKAGKM